jgi:regulatory protein
MSRPFRSQTSRPPLSAGELDALALRYVGKYATSRARLRDYLHRKLRERGYSGETAPPLDAVVERCAALGYVDDEAYAAARGRALGRRGFGERRVSVALRAAGIDEGIIAGVCDSARDEELAAGLVYARRKRIGPFRAGDADPDRRRREMASLLRAGHSHEIARRIAFAANVSELGST